MGILRDTRLTPNRRLRISLTVASFLIFMASIAGLIISDQLGTPKRARFYAIGLAFGREDRDRNTQSFARGFQEDHAYIWWYLDFRWLANGQVDPRGPKARQELDSLSNVEQGQAVAAFIEGYVHGYDGQIWPWGRPPTD